MTRDTLTMRALTSRLKIANSDHPLQTVTLNVSPSSGALRRRFHRDVSGILLLDKPLGLSSNAALQQVRVLYGALKAGHAGSLDPLASGALPVCFGQATKVCGRLLDSAKTYLVGVKLGARTESGDLETQIIERAEVPALTRASVETALAGFRGEQMQIPPMHSALKFEGQRLYELARRGETVERPARRISIYDIKVVNLGSDQLEFAVHCSKGTYIRSLAGDIAARLGTLGYVESLRRLSVDPFTQFPMHTLEELGGLSDEERDSKLLGADIVFDSFGSVVVPPAAEKLLLQGQTVRAELPQLEEELRAYSSSGEFLGVVAGCPDGRIRPVRLFVDPLQRPVVAG
jgi:tRNA pseudouridine55 synthase